MGLKSCSLREMPDCVFVRGLEFEGNHGYTAAERRGSRRFRVSVTLETPRAAVAIELEKLAPPCPGVPASCGVRLAIPAPL